MFGDEVLFLHANLTRNISLVMSEYMQISIQMDKFPKRPMNRWSNVCHISKHAPVFSSPSLYQFSSVHPVICSKSRKAPAAVHVNFLNMEVQHHIVVRVHVVSLDVHFAFLVSTFFSASPCGQTLDLISLHTSVKNYSTRHWYSMETGKFQPEGPTFQ